MKVDQAAGVDDMSSCILKAGSEEIALPVAMVFRKSLDIGCVPRDWRSENVTPLFKKGSDMKLVIIVLLALPARFAKWWSLVFRDKIVYHLDKYELIRNSQHGFRKGFFCTFNLLAFLEKVTADIDAKHNVDTIYLDFAKAFDKVPHK